MYPKVMIGSFGIHHADNTLRHLVTQIHYLEVTHFGQSKIRSHFVSVEDNNVLLKYSSLSGATNILNLY